MATKGLGIYAEADAGWDSHLKDIFKNSGIAAASYAIAKVALASEPKTKTSAKGNEVSVARLRFQLATEVLAKEGAKLPTLIAAGDDVHVVWIGHGAYMSQEDGKKKSVKFAPHHGTKGEQAYMSAKELARVVYNVCRTAAGASVYPASLTITSCYSGTSRQPTLRESAVFDGKATTSIITMSKSENPLAWRVLDNLHSFFNPAPGHTCRVAGPTRELSGMEIRTLKIPISPAAKDWAVGQL